ncbi:MAG: nucleoside deaminase [Bacteriovoracaceae bacterium]|nr:nucleoside deaminase [Bacteriovoracaceae bacterium]
MKNNIFMSRAIELSQIYMRQNKGGPFGAVIVKDDKIVGEGWNQVFSINDPTAHAEVMAIRNTCANLKTFDLSGCTLYTSCEPCPMCLSATYWAHIDHLYYANSKKDAASIQFDDLFIYEEFAKPIDQRKIPMKQIMQEKAYEVFLEWDKKSDKIKY